MPRAVTASTLLPESAAFRTVSGTPATTVPGRVQPMSVATWLGVVRQDLGYSIDEIPDRALPMPGAVEAWAQRLSDWMMPDLGAAFGAYADEAAEIAETTYEAAAQTWPEQ